MTATATPDTRIFLFTWSVEAGFKTPDDLVAIQMTSDVPHWTLSVGRHEDRQKICDSNCFVRELIMLLADHEWLDDATKSIGHFRRRKNARRDGLTLE
jgi:hypothetical protein